MYKDTSTLLPGMWIGENLERNQEIPHIIGYAYSLRVTNFTQDISELNFTLVSRKYNFKPSLSQFNYFWEKGLAQCLNSPAWRYLPESQVGVDCQRSALCLDEHKSPFLTNKDSDHGAENMFHQEMPGGPAAAVTAYSWTTLSQNRTMYTLTKTTLLLLLESWRSTTFYLMHYQLCES